MSTLEPIAALALIAIASYTLGSLIARWVNR